MVDAVQNAVDWATLVDDDAAIWSASVNAAGAYRALVGTIPAATSLTIDTNDGFLGPLLAILTGWAGGTRAAVDLRRARRLFWVHWLGAELFATSFPDEGPVIATDQPRGHDGAAKGAWTLARRAEYASAARPVAALRSPWPADVTLLLLGSLGLLELLPSLSAGGRVICPDAPYSPPR